MSRNLAVQDRIECDARRGCAAFIDGFSIPEWKEAGRPKGSGLRIVRVVARRLHGWATDIPQQRRGAQRLDFCPDHKGEA